MNGLVRNVSVLQSAAAIALLAGMSAPSLGVAAEIGWIQTNITRTATADGSVSTCQADFKSGERAEVSSTCKYGPPDSIGWSTWSCESEYRFKDRSTFVLIFKGHNEPGGRISNASATFNGGTGRFKNMTGAALGIGYAGKMQWNGSYSADAGKP